MSKKRLSIEDYIEQIQAEIRHCSYCQTYDGGEIVWIFGRRVNLEDLFDDYRVPEKFREEVAKGLSCPGCSAQLERWADVGVAFEFEEAHEQRIEEARKRYESALIEFDYHLREYPYLGAAHPIGKKILKEIKLFPTHELNKSTWFRARRVTSGGRLTTADMFPPDPSRFLVPEGRYNHAGQAYWYLASTKESAAAEVVGPSEEFAWVQGFQVEEGIKVLDVRAWEADDERSPEEEGTSNEVSLTAVALVFTDLLVQWTPRDATQKPEYHVPRFVADAAKQAGFPGIIFRSPRHLDDNLVIFDREFKFRPICSSELVRLPEHLVRIREEGLFYIGGFPMLPLPPSIIPKT